MQYLKERPINRNASIITKQMIMSMVSNAIYITCIYHDSNEI